MDAQPTSGVKILSFHFLYIYKFLFQTKWQYIFWDLVAPTFIVPYCFAFGMLPNSMYKYLSHDIYVFLFVDFGLKTNNKSVHMYILQIRAILNFLMNTLYFVLDVSSSFIFEYFYNIHCAHKLHIWTISVTQP